MQVTHYINNETGKVDNIVDSIHSENTAPPVIAGYTSVTTHDLGASCDYCVKMNLPVTATKPDPVNHPAHYMAGGIEVIDYMKAKMSPEAFRGLLHGNVIKYISRYSFKGGVEDLQKAEWYLQKLIEEEQTPSS